MTASYTYTLSAEGDAATPSPPSPPLWQAIVSLVLVFLMFITMSMERAPPEMVMMLTLLLFIPLGILTPAEAFQGFSNESMLAVMFLLITSAGLTHTGALELIKKIFLFGQRKDKPEPTELTLLRVALLIGSLSAFLNNTPLVAMFIPIMQDLGRISNVSPSKLLMPLSYATILGGTCTLMGTSTNLVAVGLLKQNLPGYEMGIFDLGTIGLPILLAGTMYLTFLSTKILPGRAKFSTDHLIEYPRQYVICLQVKHASFVRSWNPIVVIKSLVGVYYSVANKCIEEAGLFNLPGVRLMELRRGDEVIASPGPRQILLAGDLLLFAGVVDDVLQLTQIRGLEVSEHLLDHEERSLRHCTMLAEAVVAANGPLAGRLVREIDFRTNYNAAIIAIHRRNEPVHQRIGDVILHAGDALILVTHHDFVRKYRYSDFFALVRPINDFNRIRRPLAPLAILIMTAMIVISTATSLSLLICAAFASGLMLLSRCMTPTQAKDAVMLDLMIMISVGFGLSQALVNSGGAKLVATALVKAAEPTGEWGLLIVIYVCTSLFNAMVTNNASVAIMFPVAFEIYKDGHMPLDKMLYCLMFAGSADFMTPFGNQTNTMVYGPGAYKFLDYIRFGGPLQLLAMVCSIIIIQTLEYWWIYTLALGFICGIVMALYLARDRLRSAVHRRRRSPRPSEPSSPTQRRHRRTVQREDTEMQAFATGPSDQLNASMDPLTSANTGSQLLELEKNKVYITI